MQISRVIFFWEYHMVCILFYSPANLGFSSHFFPLRLIFRVDKSRKIEGKYKNTNQSISVLFIFQGPCLIFSKTMTQCQLIVHKTWFSDLSTVLRKVVFRISSNFPQWRDFEGFHFDNRGLIFAYLFHFREMDWTVTHVLQTLSSQCCLNF